MRIGLTMRSQTSMAISGIALALTSTFLTPAITKAQGSSARPDSSPARTARLCWRGKPAPTCGVFWITEFRFESAVLTTSTRYGSSEIYEDFGSRLVWTIGPMSNQSGARAVGGTLTLGGSSNGLHAAVEGRYRHWTSWGGSIDLSAGVARTRLLSPSTYGAAYGPTAAILIVGGDLLEVSARGDLALGRARPVAATSLGVGLGSYAAAGGTVVFGVLLAVAIAAFAHFE